jgi:hypothetical protein
MEEVISLEKVFQFREGVRFFNFDEISFVVDTADVSLYNLGSSSALISANLDGKNDFGKMIEIVRKSYNATAAESETAVMKFIATMQEKNLIQEVG